MRSVTPTTFLPQADAVLLRSGDEAGITRLQSRAHGAPAQIQGPPGPQAIGNAKDDAFTTTEAATVAGNVFSDNGSGTDTSPVAVAAVNGSAAAVNNQIVLASGALLTLNDNGTFSYNPNGRFNATPAPNSGATNQPAHDSFTYTLINGDTATVSITINGIDNDDTVLGTVAGQILTGGVGNDTYVVINSNNISIVEAVGQGFDSLYTNRNYVLTGGAEIEWLSVLNVNGTAGGNLTGNEFAQYIIGDNGANFIDGRGGNDWLIGHGGNDIYRVQDYGDLVYENVGEGFDTITTYVSYDLFVGQDVEWLQAYDPMSSENINLSGNGIVNYLVGNNGSNILDGQAGADRMTGLGGNDTFFVDDVNDEVRDAQGEGTFDVLYTSVSYTLSDTDFRPEIEWFSTRDNSATTAINLTGNRYNQSLIGNAGNNILTGGGGIDNFYGLGGNDTYYVDNALEYVSESAGNGFDSVYTTVSFTLSAGQEIEWFSVIDINATNAMTLTGNELGQYLIGNNGDNILIGGGGADSFIGYGGNDTYFVDSASDIVTEVAGGGTDEVKTTASYTLGAGQAIESLSTAAAFGTDAINLTGNELANNVTGNDGANTLNGGGGNDVLTGRAGADIFQFTTALGAGNVDTIADMLSGTDKIALDDAVFTAIGAPGALAAGAFVIGTAAGDADDRIIYNSATGALFYDADGNGAGAAVQFATLTGNPVIAASDFQVI
jgi:serralysin